MKTVDNTFETSIRGRLQKNAGSLLSLTLKRLDQSPSSIKELSHETVLGMSALQSGQDHDFADNAIARYNDKFGDAPPGSAANLITQCLEVCNREMRESINGALPEGLKQDVGLLRRRKAHQISSGMTP